VKVKALFLLLQDEIKQMMAQGQGGSIVNTASVGGWQHFQPPALTSPANMLCFA
jgi:NAD(P)-dependent dehydrogenase (short-subunit alcohol dehydrogenase family)